MFVNSCMNCIFFPKIRVGKEFVSHFGRAVGFPVKTMVVGNSTEWQYLEARLCFEAEEDPEVLWKVRIMNFV